MYPICYSIPSYNSSTCSGIKNGYCVATNNCSCKLGYYSFDCSSYNCNNKLYNDPTNCSGNRKCVSSETCYCKYGWTFENCQTPMCNSIHSNLTSTVCNGNGNCSSVDKCACNIGFIENWCELNCNSLTYYIDLANFLNKTLNDVKVLNENLNETLKNLIILNNFNMNNLNIELLVANNPNFIPKKYLEKKKYFEFNDLMKKCLKIN
jgi:hypothetical protein